MHTQITSGMPLLVGLLIEADAPFEKWHERLLGQLRDFSGVKDVRIVLDAGEFPPVFESAIASAAFRFDNLIVKRTRLQSRPSWSSSKEEEDQSADKSDILDVLLDFRANPLRDWPPGVQAHEVWSVDFLRGDKSPEIMSMRVAISGRGAFPVSLERVSGDGIKPIDQAYCASRRSAVRNLEQAQQVIIAMILRTLRARILGKIEKEVLDPVEPLTVRYGEHSDSLQFVRSFASYAAARGADSLSKRASALTGALEPHFRLHHAKGAPLDFDPGAAQPLEKSRKQYLADPFLFQREGHLWVFFEVFDYHDDIGYIGVAQLTQSGLGPIRPVLKGGGHMSYPYVYAHDGEIYMMPECCARRRIEVWRATRFPYEWELASTALEGAYAVDSDVHYDGAKWWLLTNVAFDPSVDAGLELSVYEADGPLLRTLTPHARNPVVADVRYARNGGRIFWRDGKLYRPAQSLEYGQYGYGLYIMEVTRLSIDSFEEHPVRFIRGCHHLDSDGEDIIFDMRRGVSVRDAGRLGRPA